MGLPEIIGAAGIGLTAAGAANQYKASKQMAAAQQGAIQAQQRAEAARQTQMNLEASRKRREAVRQAIQARSLAEANANAQGALFSSGLQGGYGQIAGRLGTNVLNTSQNQELGNAIFSANRDASSAYSQYAGYQSQAALGQGLSSLGGALITNIQPLTMLGNYLTNNQIRSRSNFQFHQ